MLLHGCIQSACTTSLLRVNTCRTRSKWIRTQKKRLYLETAAKTTNNTRKKLKCLQHIHRLHTKKPSAIKQHRIIIDLCLFFPKIKRKRKTLNQLNTRLLNINFHYKNSTMELCLSSSFQFSTTLFGRDCLSGSAAGCNRVSATSEWRRIRQVCHCQQSRDRLTQGARATFASWKTHRRFYPLQTVCAVYHCQSLRESCCK
jgi:hypothetical protein